MIVDLALSCIFILNSFKLTPADVVYLTKKTDTTQIMRDQLTPVSVSPDHPQYGDTFAKMSSASETSSLSLLEDPNWIPSHHSHKQE